MTYYHTCPHCGHMSRSEWGYRFHVKSCAAGLFERPTPPASPPPTMTPLTAKYFARLQAAIARQQFEALVQGGAR